MALPLRPGATPLRFAPDYEEWLVEAMRHGNADGFWTDMGSSVVDHVAEYADVPVYHVTGWYDSWGTSVANLNYVELSRAKRAPQRLIVGPWTHGGQQVTFSGEAEFGPDARVDMNAFRERWFDRWLKGVDNGVEKGAPVRLFVMGGGDRHRTPEGRVFVGGRWRDEQEWPLARTSLTPYYLHADGRLSPDRPGASAPTTYSFDPRRPVPTIGGNVSSEGDLMLRGARDQRCRLEALGCTDTLPLATRPDVLVFETPALEQDVEVTGRLVVKLWASTSAVDTDFTAKLVDVYPPSADFPSGLALNVADSIVRGRYRESLVAERPMAPGHALRADDRDVPDLARVRARPPDPAGRLEQQLPALRREPEHGRAAGPEPPLRRRGEQRLPRPRAPVADPAADHPRRALTAGAALTAAAPSPSAPRTSSGRR